MVGGITPRVIAIAVMAASMAPAAPSVWPICPFTDDTGMRSASAPRQRRSAAVSIASLRGVAVPCAFT